MSTLAAFAAAALGVVLLGTQLATHHGHPGARQRPTARAPQLSPGLRRRQIQAGWADALDLLLLTIAAGFIPRQALHTVAEHVAPAIGQSFDAVEQRCQAGQRFADALSAVTEQLGPLANPLVDGLATADRYGLPLGPVLARLADEARHQRRRAAEAKARQLPVRLSIPMVLCTLPSFVLMAIAPLLIGALSSLRR